MSQEVQEHTSLFIPITASCLGSIVLLSYAISIYQSWTTPQLFDKDAIWALLFQKNNKPNYCAWFVFVVGETSSIIGFITTTVWLWNKPVSDPLAFFYTLFYIAEAFWMPCAIRGSEYYSATLISVLLSAIASCGLFVCTLQIWGSDNIKGYILLPFFLHCTFFDLIAWGWTFEPHSIQSKAALEQIAMFNITEDDEDILDPQKNTQNA